MGVFGKILKGVLGNGVGKAAGRAIGGLVGGKKGRRIGEKLGGLAAQHADMLPFEKGGRAVRGYAKGGVVVLKVDKPKKAKGTKRKGRKAKK